MGGKVPPAFHIAHWAAQHPVGNDDILTYPLPQASRSVEEWVLAFWRGSGCHKVILKCKSTDTKNVEGKNKESIIKENQYGK